MRVLVVGESARQAAELREALRLAGHDVVTSLEAEPDMVVMRAQEYGRLQEALAEASRKLEERKVIERAKGILMRTRGMAESDAYDALRRMAMDRGKRIGEIAQRLVDLSDVLG